MQLSMGALHWLVGLARDASACHLLLHPHLLLSLANLKPHIIGRLVVLLRVAHLRIVVGRGRTDSARLEFVLVLGSSSSRHHDFVALGVGRFVIVHAVTC